MIPLPPTAPPYPPRRLICHFFLLVAFAGAGCGGDDDPLQRDREQVLRTVKEYHGELAAGSREAACARLTSEGQRRLRRYARGAPTCAIAVKRFSADIVRFGSSPGELRTAPVRELEVQGRKALTEVRIRLGDQPTGLRKLGDTWQVDVPTGLEEARGYLR